MRILIATKPVDFRKGHDGLAAVVQSMLREVPFAGAVFVSRAKRADRLKILFWDGTGLVMSHKPPRRLFAGPTRKAAAAMARLAFTPFCVPRGGGSGATGSPDSCGSRACEDWPRSHVALVQRPAAMITRSRRTGCAGTSWRPRRTKSGSLS